jgi:predicted regulator of Ras-like GTPase activity (Roadblock/LC7/MglB family)
MSTLPEFLVSDIETIQKTLSSLLKSSEGKLVLLLDLSGFLITHVGDCKDIEMTTLGALTANTFAGTQAVAKQLGETEFSNVYHQGSEQSILVQKVDEDTLVAVIFEIEASVGTVKYYAQVNSSRLAREIEHIRHQNPGKTVNLPELNLSDSEALFKRKN